MSLKLKAPDSLPADGVTTVAFKAWKNNLFSYLEQDTENYLFLEGGTYANWTSLQEAINRKRIPELIDTDPQVVKLARKRRNDANYTQEDFDEDKITLLLKRNAQLSKFIQLICVVCHYTECDDLQALSTSATWIISYLEQHYNLEKRGAHFLKVSEISYKDNANHQTFYREFRAAIYDNLKKRGHHVQYLNNKVLEVDESLSPTFEETIVLWCLEKIDPRLPAHVNKTFGHQMTGDTTLKDLQVQIFQRIPGMIQDLDDAQANRATTLNRVQEYHEVSDTEPTLAAFRPQNSQNRGRRPQRGNFTPSGNTSGNFNASRRMCQICRLAGRPPAIVASHTQTSCKLKDAILNAASVEDIDDPEDSQLPFSHDDGLTEDQ